MIECPKWSGGQESAPNMDTVANLCIVTEVEPLGLRTDSGLGSVPWKRVGKIGSGMDSGLGCMPRKIEASDFAWQNR